MLMRKCHTMLHSGFEQGLCERGITYNSGEAPELPRAVKTKTRTVSPTGTTPSARMLGAALVTLRRRATRLALLYAVEARLGPGHDNEGPNGAECRDLLL